MCTLPLIDFFLLRYLEADMRAVGLHGVGYMGGSS